MKITDQIHYVEVGTYTLPPHNTTNCYIIGNKNPLVIDAVYSSGNELEEFISGSNISSIKYAAITHPHLDHYYGVEDLLKRLGGEILCHGLASESLPVEPDKIKTFPGNETIQVNGSSVRVVHTPGHTPGHLCFYIEKEGVLFSGDTILGRGTSIISPPEGDMTAYMESLAKLSELDIRIICPGHGPVILDYAEEWIKWYIEHRLMREGRIIKALRDGLSTLTNITERIYTEEDFLLNGYDLLPRAERSVLAHLIKLEKEGVVGSRNTGGSSEYFLA